MKKMILTALLGGIAALAVCSIPMLQKPIHAKKRSFLIPSEMEVKS